MANNDLLTKVEAEKLLHGGAPPANFYARLEAFIEFYDCPNCGGVEDMRFVIRQWDEPEPMWCPFCVDLQTKTNGGKS